MAGKQESVLALWINFNPSYTHHKHDKVWDEITYSLPNFNCAAIEVWEWLSNFIPHFTGHVITYPWDYKVKPC